MLLFTLSMRLFTKSGNSLVGMLSLLCVYCTVMDISVVEKGSSVKLRTLLRLLSRQFFSHFGELWLAWSHGGGITSGMSYIQIAPREKFATRLGGQSELGRHMVGFPSC